MFFQGYELRVPVVYQGLFYLLIIDNQDSSPNTDAVLAIYADTAQKRKTDIDTALTLQEPPNEESLIHLSIFKLEI